jgi:hypothetical protein
VTEKSRSSDETKFINRFNMGTKREFVGMPVDLIGEPQACHAGGGADSQRPLRAPPQPLCRLLLAAIAGAAFAARQILLHIMPGDPGYGSALLGYHYYSWAFIGFAVAIIALAATLLFDEQFRDDGKPQPLGAFARAAVWLVIALTALNVVSTLMECSFGACPDNPLAYELLKRAP